MAKRKQKAEFKTRGAGGAPLSKRRRWHSHGIDRQQTAADETLEEQTIRIEERNLLEELRIFESDSHYDYAAEAEWRHRVEPEPDEDAFLVHVFRLVMAPKLASVAPGEMQADWLSKQPEREVKRDLLEGRIENPWRTDLPLAEQVKSQFGSGEASAIIAKVSSASERLVFTEHLLYFAPLYLRSPQTFEGNTLRELMDHLFVRFPVPDVLYKAPHEPDIKWMKWFLCYAQGASLFELGQIAQGWEVPKKFQHHFASVPGNLSLIRATVFAEAQQLRLSEQVREWLMESRDFSIDLTARWLQNDAQYVDFWRRTAQWLDRHAEDLDEFDAWMLLTWSSRQFRLEEFSWSGRTVAASLRHAEELLQNEPFRYTRWRNKGWDVHSADGWSIEEICSTKALREEGLRMQHCVASYAYLYQGGKAALFSLQFSGKRAVTIQINPQTGGVDEIRGRYNRSPTKHELQIVEEWLSMNSFPAE